MNYWILNSAIFALCKMSSNNNSAIHKHYKQSDLLYINTSLYIGYPGKKSLLSYITIA